MFDEVRLGGGERSLVVQTRRGRSLPNIVELDPGPREREAYELSRKKHGQSWRNRKPACGVYNCFGMVFASRRTSILPDGDEGIYTILKDDEYRKLRDEQEAMVGDLVLYKDLRIGLLHLATITRRDELKVLHALSKWNSTSGEDEHHLRHHCWTAPGFEVGLEFWTDRPHDAG